MNQKPLIRRFGGQYNAADFQSVFVIGFAGLYGFREKAPSQAR